MDIIEILDKVKNTSDCIVHSPCGLPLLGKGIKLPNDLKLFYEKCGGISFFCAGLAEDGNWGKGSCFAGKAVDSVCCGCSPCVS